jgi:hypothetical protein
VKEGCVCFCVCCDAVSGLCQPDKLSYAIGSDARFAYDKPAICLKWWMSEPALGAGGPRFKSGRPDLISQSTVGIYADGAFSCYRPGRVSVEFLPGQATNNTKEQFANSPDLKSELMKAIIGALDAHSAMSTQALRSEAVREGLKDVLLNHAQLYESLRQPLL